jgi:hypothetical protein
MRSARVYAAVLVAFTGALARPCAGSESTPENSTQVAAVLPERNPDELKTALAKYDDAAAKLEATERQMMLSCVGPASMQQSLEAAKTELASAREWADKVAGQRGATVSRLFWYTDLDQARHAAAESGKPILSLRMLGMLTDEYSCANSRFFRTALYSNKEISDYLREHFILHWQSVRPVPRITIDFGDGRKLERTITGNSAHYVLDAEGRPLDVLPGLYGPQAFEAWLKRTSELASRLSNAVDRQRTLAAYHVERLSAVQQAMNADFAAVAPQLGSPESVSKGQTQVSNGAPQASALKAGNRAVSKRLVEAPLAAAIALGDDVLLSQDDSFWRAVAARHAGDAMVDDASLAIVRKENPTDPRRAGFRAMTKARVEDPILRVVRDFQQAMAVDTVKNEYTLHRKAHQWFVAGDARTDVDSLNERVYAELFLTPSSDPWLGLAPADAYTGLVCGGLTSTAPPQQSAD